MWTKKENVEAGIVQDTLVMIVDIFNGLEELLIERVSNGAPPKIGKKYFFQSLKNYKKYKIFLFFSDVFASPFYPVKFFVLWLNI